MENQPNQSIVPHPDLTPEEHQAVILSVQRKKALGYLSRELNRRKKAGVVVPLIDWDNPPQPKPSKLNGQGQ